MNANIEQGELKTQEEFIEYIKQYFPTIYDLLFDGTVSKYSNLKVDRSASFFHLLIESDDDYEYINIYPPGQYDYDMMSTWSIDLTSSTHDVYSDFVNATTEQVYSLLKSCMGN